MSTVSFKVDLQDWEAYALALFCHRSVFEYFLACSDGGNDKAEAYRMISAIATLRHALGEALDQFHLSNKG